MSDPSDLTPFSDYYGVVLTHQFSGPLRWSPIHEAWLRRTSSDLAWAADPVEGDEVDEDELVAALTLARDFPISSSCPRCWAAPTPSTHYIAIDVVGEPTVYCVQQPTHEVVGARGGRGVKKHSGSPFGCIAAKAETVTGSVLGVGRHAVVAGYVYGEPLMADEVMLRTWCSRCMPADDVRSVGSKEMLDEHDYRAKALLQQLRLHLDL